MSEQRVRAPRAEPREVIELRQLKTEQPDLLRLPRIRNLASGAHAMPLAGTADEGVLS